MLRNKRGRPRKGSPEHGLGLPGWEAGAWKATQKTVPCPSHQVAELTQDSVVATLFSGVKKSSSQFHVILEWGGGN